MRLNYMQIINRKQMNKKINAAKYIYTEQNKKRKFAK